MVYDWLLVRPGELFLKGKNRSSFEKKLVENICRIAEFRFPVRIQGRLIYLYGPDHLKLKQVFGIKSYSPAIKCEKEVERIKQSALSLIKNKQGRFKVETKRSDKSFPIKSLDLNIIVGKYIEDNSSLEFSLKNFDFVLNIEINQNGVFLFTETINCLGGLPTGIEGTAALLVEHDADLLAGLLMMKRGVGLEVYAFKKIDISLLNKYSPHELKLNLLKNINDIKENVLIVGETFDNLNKYPPTVLRPLIAYEPGSIKAELNKFSSL